MKRGQAALEYLMTYGWAILIIIIIGVALYAMGIFNPSTFTGKKYSGLSEFTVIDFKANSSDFIVVVSPRGHTIKITDLKAYVNGKPATNPSGITGTTYGPADKVTLDFTPDANAGLNTGSTYNANLTITYQDIQTGLTHKSVGTFSGKVE